MHFGTAEQVELTAGHRPGDPKVMPVHLKIENPLRVSDEQANVPKLLQEELVKQGIIAEDMVDLGWDADPLTQSRLFSQLESVGYDGLVYTNEAEGAGDSYVPFHPTQVKSAIGNIGTFDPTDLNITNRG